MITIEQLKSIKERTEALYRYLDIEGKKIQVEEEQLRTQAPGFWDDQKTAEAQMKKVKGENGNYLVKTLENGYSITKEGETTAMELVYDKELNTWNVVAEGVSTELLQMNGDGTAQMYLPNGEAMNVTLDAQGVAAARQATMINTYYAAR